MSDLDDLRRDLNRASNVRAEVRAVVSKGALNIKEDWRTSASGLAHAPRYPASITYDLHSGPGFIEAEIGPDKDKAQGALGNLIEFGSAHNPPHNDGGRALQAEEPRFENAMDDVADRLLR